jgi:membrane protease YdiL (CAAX protease family)
MTDPEREPLESTVPLQAEILPPVREPIDYQLTSTPEPSAAAARDFFPPWSGWDVAAVLGFTLAAVFLFSTVTLGVAHVLTSKQHASWSDLASNPIVVIGSQVAAYPIVIVFMMTLVRSKARERFWPAIRWNWPGPAMLRFLLAGVAFAFAVEFVSRWLPIPKSLPVDKFFADTRGAYLMAAFGVTLAPLLEELFFRGMLYPVLRRAVGVDLAVVLTAIAFAFIHGAQLGYAWAPLLSIFVVGIVFTVVRERTDSVAASFLMHCGYNLALFITLWVGSDHFRHLELALNSGCYR